MYEHMIVPDAKRIKSTPKIVPKKKIEKQPYFTPQYTGKTLPIIKEELFQQK